MNKIKNHFNHIIRLTLLFALGIATLLAPFGVTHAQEPGTNGRILWAAPSNYYSIFADGSSILNTSIPSTIIPAKWAGVYNPAGTKIYYPSTCTSGVTTNTGLFSIANTLSPAGSQIFCPSGANPKIIKEPTESTVASQIALVVARTDISESDVHVIALDGSTNTRLTNQINSTNSTNPVWSANGTNIFINNSNNIYRISALTANQTTADIGTTVIQLTTDGTDQNLVCRLSDIDPTGSTLLFSKRTSGSCNDKTSPNGPQLWAVSKTAGSVATPITNEPSMFYIGGYYSPDGTQIVAVRFNSSNSLTELVTMAADGSTTPAVVANVAASSSGPGVLNTGSSSLSYRPFWSIDQTTPVTTAPTCTLSATPNTLTAAGNTTISWTSTNATSLTLDQNLGAVTPVAAGSASAVINSTVTVTGTATGPSGSGTCSATVTVAAASGGGGTLANAGRNLLTGAFVGLIILGSVFALNSTEIKKLAKAIARKK